MEEGILAIVSHPDDETFGCGGTLALHAMKGFKTGVLCLTCSPPERRDEISKAAEVLGIPKPVVLDKVRISLDGDLIRRVSDVIVSSRPRVVVTHLPFDYHHEHRLTHDLVKEAVEWAAHTTTYSDPWLVERLLLMEVNTLISSPHVLVDISEVIGKKMEAIDKYKSQLKKFPWRYYQTFSLKKAELRGAQAGCKYAEAFLEEPLPRNSPFYKSKCTRSIL